MKSMLSLAICLSIITCAAAQTPIDSLEKELGEIVVQADQIISKADRKLYFPQSEQIKSSANGTDLLRKMNMPSVIVSPLDQSIKLTSNGSIDLRINGRSVSQNEIQTIDPRTVVRVEYHDNPSLRFGSAEVVIDFIVKNPTSGGSFFSNLTQGLNKGYNNFNNNLKLNNKKSEFSLTNNFSAHWDMGQWRDNTEYYTRADGSTYERVEDGELADATEFRNWTGINYNFTDPDKQMLNVQARMNYDNDLHNDYMGVLTNSDTGKRYKMKDINSSLSMNPSLDLYYQRNLKKDQLIMFNAVGTIAPSKSQRNYTEQPLLEDDKLAPYLSTYINTSIKGMNYHFVAEADYEKLWKKSRFTGGVKYTGSWSNSEYLESNQESKTSWSNIYAFGEYWRRLGKKVDMTVGLAVTQYFNHTAEVSNSSFFVRPKLNLRYRPSQASTLRFNLSSHGKTPSISQLTSVQQQIDNTQVSKGNGYLENYTTYRAQVQYEFAKKSFYGYLRSTYRYSPNPIMEYKYREGENIISSFANHKNAHIFNYEAHAGVKNWKEWVTASAHFGFNRYIMHGNNYTHTYNNPYWNLHAEVSHWGWSLGTQITYHANSLWGETIGGGESAYFLVATKKYKNLFFMLGAMNPFSNEYKVESQNLNQLAGYKRTSYLQATNRLFVFNFSWNIQWGRKHQSASKRLDNSSGSESVKTTGK